MIVSHNRACVGLLSRPGIYYISSNSLQRRGKATASSSFGLQALLFSQYQNGSLMDCRDAC